MKSEELNPNEFLLCSTDALKIIEDTTGKKYKYRTLCEYVRRRIFPQPLLKHRGELFFDREEFLTAIKVRLKEKKAIIAPA